MRAMDRHKMRVAELVSEPLSEDDVFFGDASSDVSTYLPLAAGLISEITAKELKKKEDKEKEAKLKSSEGYKAQQDALEARKKAEMAKADALTEVDPNGPKHRRAAQLDLEALAAEQKARYYAMSGGPMSTSTAIVPAGYVPPPASPFTTKNILIGGGVLLGLGLVVMLARKK